MVAVALCKQKHGICLYKAVKESENRFYVVFEYHEAHLDKIKATLLDAMRSGSVVSKDTRAVAVVDGPNSPLSRLVNTLEDCLPRASVVLKSRQERVFMCEAATGRCIEEETLGKVTGGTITLRSKATSPGTSLHTRLIKLQNKYMCEEAAKFLQDPSKCANPAEASASFSAAQEQSGDPMAVSDALWCAVAEAMQQSFSAAPPAGSAAAAAALRAQQTRAAAAAQANAAFAQAVQAAAAAQAGAAQTAAAAQAHAARAAAAGEADAARTAAAAARAQGDAIRAAAAAQAHAARAAPAAQANAARTAAAAARAQGDASRAAAAAQAHAARAAAAAQAKAARTAAAAARADAARTAAAAAAQARAAQAEQHQYWTRFNAYFAERQQHQQQQRAQSGGTFFFYQSGSQPPPPQQHQHHQQQQQQQHEHDHQQQRKRQRQEGSAAGAGAGPAGARAQPAGFNLADLAAEQPAAVLLPLAELQAFLAQQAPAGAAVPDLNACTAESQLKLWECRRLLMCGRALNATDARNLTPQQHQQRYQYALAVFRLVGVVGSSATISSKHRVAYKKLALLMHPDKVPPELQVVKCVFEAAFKVLGNADELLA